MLRLSLCLPLAAALLLSAGLNQVHAQAAKAKSAAAPVTPRYDAPDQPFRMAPMPQSTRSIVVPLATNLHLAFDTALLRTHTVWSGRGLALLGPQYGLPKSPFISTNDGTVLWTMPPVFPWAVGKMPEKSLGRLPDGWRFNGVSAPADLAYGSTNIGVMERAFALRLPVNGMARQFAVTTGPGMSRPDLSYLAHAEMGHVELLRTAPPVALVERTNDALLVSLDIRGARDGAKPYFEVMEKEVDYEVELVTEQSTEKLQPKQRITGKQARVYVCIPATDKSDASVHFDLYSEVFPTIEAARIAGQARTDSGRDWRPEGLPAKPRRTAELQSGAAEAKPSQAGNASYRGEAFPLPPGANLQITGLAFLRGGHLALCTWAGEVWVVENATGPVEKAKYRRMASGLCEPMGIVERWPEVFIGTKQGLFRLEAYEWAGSEELCRKGVYQIGAVSQNWGYTGSYNAFVYGPVFDRAGNLVLANAGHGGRWDAPYMGWALRISRDGKRLDPICSGLREPNGIGTFGPDRDVFVSENQGAWIGACKLNHVAPGKFYGHPSAWPAKQEEYGKHTRFDPPAIWFPYKLARSVTGFAEITDDRFGPFKGQLMVGDFQNAIVTRVQLEKVNGEYQGAVWPFLKQFQSGVNRLAYGPDGKLYVGGCQAPVSWKAVAPLDFALERISYTGKLPFEVKEVHALRDGFELTFTQPVEAKVAANPESYDVTQYGYKYHAKYGSPEIDHDGKENAATVIKIAAATVSPDKLKVRLKLEGWKPGYVTMVRSLDVKNATGEALVNDTFWYTLNHIPK